MASLQAAAKGGRIVTCGATSGPNPKEEIRLIFWKQLSILGSTMANDREFRALLSAVASGRLKPRIDETFPFSRAAEAYRRMEEGLQHGKIVLVPDDSLARTRRPGRVLTRAQAPKIHPPDSREGPLLDGKRRSDVPARARPLAPGTPRRHRVAGGRATSRPARGPRGSTSSAAAEARVRPRERAPARGDRGRARGRRRSRAQGHRPFGGAFLDAVRAAPARSGGQPRGFLPPRRLQPDQVPRADGRGRDGLRGHQESHRRVRKAPAREGPRDLRGRGPLARSIRSGPTAQESGGSGGSPPRRRCSFRSARASGRVGGTSCRRRRSSRRIFRG